MHVAIGDVVAKGKVIGAVGATGNVRGKDPSHLHTLAPARVKKVLCHNVGTKAQYDNLYTKDFSLPLFSSHSTTIQYSYCDMSRTDFLDPPSIQYDR